MLLFGANIYIYIYLPFGLPNIFTFLVGWHNNGTGGLRRPGGLVRRVSPAGLRRPGGLVRRVCGGPAGYSQGVCCGPAAHV